MPYSKNEMKMMAAGEVGAVLLGPVAAYICLKNVNIDSLFLRLILFLTVWLVATKFVLWFIHIGYHEDGKM